MDLFDMLRKPLSSVRSPGRACAEKTLCAIALLVGFLMFDKDGMDIYMDTWDESNKDTERWTLSRLVFRSK